MHKVKCHVFSTAIRVDLKTASSNNDNDQTV